MLTHRLHLAGLMTKAKVYGNHTQKPFNGTLRLRGKGIIRALDLNLCLLLGPDSQEYCDCRERNCRCRNFCWVVLDEIQK